MKDITSFAVLMTVVESAPKSPIGVQLGYEDLVTVKALANDLCDFYYIEYLNNLHSFVILNLHMMHTYRMYTKIKSEIISELYSSG